MQTLAVRLAERLRRTRVLTRRAALGVRPGDRGYEVELDGGERLARRRRRGRCTRVRRAQSFSQSSTPDLAAAHEEIPYASSAIVTLGYRTDDVAHPLDGYGYVVPRAEGSDVLACSWTSSKWEGRAPEGSVLLRVFAGRFGGRDVTADSDDELVALARDELRLLEIDAEPYLSRVHRWPRGMPQYVLGHPERLERIDAALADHPGLAARRSRVSRSRHPRLHPLRRGGRALARGVARSRSRMTRETSERLFAEALELMPGGVSSPVRAFRAVGGDPLFIERGEGAYLVDVDGNRYLDYVLSWGPLILGHAHPRVVAALEEAVRRGTSYGAPSPLELELARLIRDAMPSIELVRFVSSGTEATMSALRVARAFTERSKIVKFTGCYHGHADLLLVQAGSGVATLGLPDSPGVTPGAVADTLTAPYNDLAGGRAAVRRARGRDRRGHRRAGRREHGARRARRRLPPGPARADRSRGRAPRLRRGDDRLPCASRGCAGAVRDHSRT